MRILVVAPGPGFSVADVQHGWENALGGLGNDVRTFDLDNRIAFFGNADFGGEIGKLTAEQAIAHAVEGLGNACYHFWPDVILVVSGFFIPDYFWDTWKRFGRTTVLLCTESPYEDDRQFAQVQRWEPTHVLLNDPVNLLKFKTIHDSVLYAPHAYDPKVHFPGLGRGRPVDFSFVGTGYPSRIDFFARTDFRGINAKLAGMWSSTEGTVLEDLVIHDTQECFDNADAADLYRSSKISANLYRGGTVAEANDPSLTTGYAVGPREIELAATQTFFLRESRAEGDELFPMLPTFSEPGEFSELLRYYLAHDDQRLQAAARAREAITDRTFDAHARQLMHLLSA